uniref:Coiled-coil-helix-coiled-coil-helix domain containing 6b n=1 Tax=Myripristis murdjan TaxID=586833 RepID=A0A667Y3M0_9TELE
MGANGSTTRKVSFGLDEEEKVTIIQGVKVGTGILGEMQGQSLNAMTYVISPKPTGPSAAEIQEELRKKFEREQALVQEHLARLAQKEREAAAATQGLDELNPAVLIEKGKTHEELEKAKILARQLERKEKELASISAFYREQLETLEKRLAVQHQPSAVLVSHRPSSLSPLFPSRPRCTASVCTELQAQVLQCYRENPQQTLLCSGLAKEYMTCIQQAKKKTLLNH